MNKNKLKTNSPWNIEDKGIQYPSSKRNWDLEVIWESGDQWEPSRA